VEALRGARPEDFQDRIKVLEQKQEVVDNKSKLQKRYSSL
jgi:hypothetical protein